MPASVDRLLGEALALSDLEQSELTARLLEKLEPETWSPEDWEQEIRQRVEDIRAGTARMIPWEQARTELWKAADSHAGD